MLFAWMTRQHHLRVSEIVDDSPRYQQLLWYYHQPRDSSVLLPPCCLQLPFYNIYQEYITIFPALDLPKLLLPFVSCIISKPEMVEWNSPQSISITYITVVYNLYFCFSYHIYSCVHKLYFISQTGFHIISYIMWYIWRILHIMSYFYFVRFGTPYLLHAYDDKIISGDEFALLHYMNISQPI